MHWFPKFGKSMDTFRADVKAMLECKEETADTAPTEDPETTIWKFLFGNLGNAYGKSKQVARCGNAVCPPLAEAMVRANFPEWYKGKINTMAQFHDAVAV